jgi:arsenate reductase
MTRPRVLFLCTHNSARSQMAEGLLRALAGDRFEVGSAGTEKTAVNPLAIRAMAEEGIDISGHTSKRYEDVAPPPWDYLITVCDDAKERCPFVPGSVKRLHWSFPDPSRAVGSDEHRLAVFRGVRDQLRERITAWLGEPTT